MFNSFSRRRLVAMFTKIIQFKKKTSDTHSTPEKILSNETSNEIINCNLHCNINEHSNRMPSLEPQQHQVILLACHMRLQVLTTVKVNSDAAVTT